MADWQPLGDRAVRLVRPPHTSPAAILRAIRAWSGVIDIVVTKDHVGVYFDGEPQVDSARVASLTTLVDDSEPSREIALAVTYDGVDLDDVARATGLRTEEVVRLHVSATYIVDTIGFAPGFAYLVGLDSRLAHVRRRATPRTRVAAGSLGLAGGHCGVYPFDSPGGWNIIGRVHEQMFGPDGARLRLGDRVRFVR